MVKQIIFGEVIGYGSTILNLITCANFRVRYSILKAHLGLL